MSAMPTTIPSSSTSSAGRSTSPSIAEAVLRVLVDEGVSQHEQGLEEERRRAAEATIDRLVRERGYQPSSAKVAVGELLRERYQEAREGASPAASEEQKP